MLRLLKRVGVNLAVAAVGFFAGVLLLYIWWVQNGAPLQPWHEVVLDGEFTAAKAAQVADFAGYLKLEERLQSELDARVYAKTPTGPGYVLVRYSRGSASDPEDRKPNWNRSFEIGPEDAFGGVLLLHGMSDGPYSLRAIGESLAEHGYRVVGMRMPGHGFAPSGLLDLTWEDMSAAVRIGMQQLGRELKDGPVHLVGYSTGAALAVQYALDAMAGRESPAPASLVLISPAIGVTPVATLTPWIDRLGHLPGLPQLRWTAILPEMDPFRFNSFTANASLQVRRMTRSIASRVRELAASGPIAGFPPTLIFLSSVDSTVVPAAAPDNLLRFMAPGRNELVLYDINRFAVKSPLVVADPGPLTGRLMDDASLPFSLTLIGNASDTSRDAVARHKTALSAEISSTEPLGEAWPNDVIALSHVALPFPPNDPLYGVEPPTEKGKIYLGQLAIRGENGVLKLPATWLLRLRYNPFFDYQERRVLDWIDRASGRSEDRAVALQVGGVH